MYRRIIFSYLLLSFFFSGTAQSQNFPKGKIFQEKTAVNSELSYQVYLPNSIKNQPTAVLIIFDPSGYSTNAMSLFQDAAERCQTIILCSDQSRNGPYQRNLDIFEVMYADVKNKFGIEKLPKMLAGFSGGSRLATALAVLHPEIGGVIACGAGFPHLSAYQPTVGEDFGYFGIVGRQDMNYSEILKVEMQMQEMKLDHHFVYTEAGHRWPEADLHTQALIWQLARLEQKGKLESNTFTVQFFDTAKKQLDSLGKNDEIVSYANLKLALKSTFPKRMEDFQFLEINEVELVKAREKQQELIKMEAALKTKYYDAYQLSVHKILDYKPDEWWILEYKKWSKLSTKPPKNNADQASRIQNFLSASFIERCFAWMAEKEYDKAAWTANILGQMVKNEPYPYFLEAKVAALQEKYKMAEKKLELAVKNGLTKRASILGESAFEEMKGRKRFEKILAELE